MRLILFLESYNVYSCIKGFGNVYSEESGLFWFDLVFFKIVWL